MNIAVGKKLNMTQHFMPSGEVIPVTVIKTQPLVVTQVKTLESKDKYNAVQVAVPNKISGSKRANKALTGHLKGAKAGSLVEFRSSEAGQIVAGQSIDISGFQVGELVDISGKMKGRGFAGAIKRHGFAGFPGSHGHDRPRSVGSIGQRFPQHTRKGLRMSGHMGTQNVTAKNLQIVDIDVARGILMVKGAVPGSRGGAIKIVSTGKVKPLVIEEKLKDDKKKK